MRAPERSSFTVRSQDCEPAYLTLHRSGELAERARLAVESLEHCIACPRRCGADRLADERGTCKVGRHAIVSSHFPHHGEEDCLRGRAGSGTIFFSMCNLACVFCQNWEISHDGEGRVVDAARLAAMMLELQQAGCHNINFVTPEHIVPQILESLPLAVEQGLRLPLVYNTSGYDALDSLRLLDGVVDVYMPDFKMWDPQAAECYLGAADYPEAARRALREMHRQVGALRLDEHGLARRGVLVRHLVMPGGLAGTREVCEFLARELSPDTYVNLMAQYHPAGRVSPREFGEIARRITDEEYAEAFALARAAGLHRFDGAPEGN